MTLRAASRPSGRIRCKRRTSVWETTYHLADELDAGPMGRVVWPSPDDPSQFNPEGPLSRSHAPVSPQ